MRLPRPETELLATFGFGSPGVLGWLVVAALPWLIYWLWQRRRREVSWGAVDLLLEAIRRRAGQVRRRQWLLLTLRSAILVVAVLAAARPWWSSAGLGRQAGSAVHHVLVLDCSYSMDVRQGGVSRLGRAQRRALQVIEALQSGDSATVVAWGPTTQILTAGPGYDRSAARSAIESTEIAPGGADLADALRVSSEICAEIVESRETVPELQVTFFSDRTARTWASLAGTSDDASELSATARLWQQLNAEAEVAIVTIDDDVRFNVAVAEVRIASSAGALGRPDGVVVEVASWGELPAVPDASSARVELVANGVLVGTREIALGNPRRVAATLPWVPDSQSRYLLEARLVAPGDALPIDDRRTLDVTIAFPLRVALFEGWPGAGDEIARALNPQFDAPLAAAGPVEVARYPVARLAADSLADREAVVMADVGQLSEREERILRRYVADGGALFVVLGQGVAEGVGGSPWRAASIGSETPSPSTTGRPGTAESAGDWLPARIAGEVRRGDWQIDPRGFADPITAPFGNRPRAGLQSVMAAAYFPLTVRDTDDDADPVRVVLGLATGDPLLVWGRYRQGAAAVLATSPALTAREGPPWTNWALSPSFVPIVNGLLATLMQQAAREGKSAAEFAREWAAPATAQSLPNLPLDLRESDLTTVSRMPAEGATISSSADERSEAVEGGSRGGWRQPKATELGTAAALLAATLALTELAYACWLSRERLG
jgi:hypothetical protein